MARFVTHAIVLVAVIGVTTLGALTRGPAELVMAKATSASSETALPAQLPLELGPLATAPAAAAAQPPT
jgi:hypothetical protein